jgi:hypothetical protein
MQMGRKVEWPETLGMINVPKLWQNSRSQYDQAHVPKLKESTGFVFMML